MSGVKSTKSDGGKHDGKRKRKSSGDRKHFEKVSKIALGGLAKVSTKNGEMKQELSIQHRGILKW